MYFSLGWWLPTIIQIKRFITKNCEGASVWLRPPLGYLKIMTRASEQDWFACKMPLMLSQLVILQNMPRTMLNSCMPSSKIMRLKRAYYMVIKVKCFHRVDEDPQLWHDPNLGESWWCSTCIFPLGGGGILIVKFGDTCDNHLFSRAILSLRIRISRVFEVGKRNLLSLKF